MARQSLTTRIASKQRDNRYENYINSFEEPYPVNPLKRLRVNAGLSLEGLGSLVGLSKQTLIRAEQGLFDEVPMKLLDYWQDQDVNLLSLTNSYEYFQLTVRSRHHRIFGNRFNLGFHLPDHQDERNGTERTERNGSTLSFLHPMQQLFQSWVAGAPMNTTECAKLLCISQPLLSHWIRNPRQAKVPGPLVSALIQNGYSKAEVRKLISAYAAYRKELGYER